MNFVRRVVRSAAAIVFVPAVLMSQDRLKDMPGSAQAQRMSPVIGQVNQQIGTAGSPG